MTRIEDFRGIVDDEVLADLHRRASKLFNRKVTHINSTGYGGGVAEILLSLVPLMNDSGVRTEWRVLVGNNDFFAVTKKLHNALQGEQVRLTEQKLKLWEDTNESFARYTDLNSSDVVIVHDPQPLALIRYYRKRQPWIWRCHIDLSNPEPALWDYLKGYMLRYDMVVVSHDSYLHPDLPVPQVVVHPAIDPLSQKNMDLPAKKIEQLLQEAKVPTDKPLITQVSRFDTWKDPLGVLAAFEVVRKDFDCRLVLAGNAATDDPESSDMLARVQRTASASIKRGDVIILLGANDTTINALQRRSTVVVQKSLREGFGLTVSEAMWKGVPVVASSVGGIPIQLRDGVDGFLVDPTDIETTAQVIMQLLNDPSLAQRMGESGREHVRKDFLTTRLVGHWLQLSRELIEASGC